MPSITKTYDPKKQLVNFSGIPLTSFADGTFITVEADEDSFTKLTGASGEVVRVLNNNRGAKVTLVLMQHSIDNDALSAIHAADRLTGEGIGMYSQTELNGTTVVQGEAWVSKWPNVERAKESSNVTWTFDMANADTFIGGLVL